jgi:hypothetical protein
VFFLYRDLGFATRRLTANMTEMSAQLRASAICLLLTGAGWCSSLAAGWENSVTAGSPGPFPPPRSLVASYHFGWAGFTAATAEVHFTRGPADHFQLDGVGHTIGLVRSLWKMDVSHHAVADAVRLRPIEVEQVENVRGKKIVTQLAFTPSGVTRVRSESKHDKATSKTKQFNFPNLFDLHSSLLYLRSQPLRERSIHRIVVYPANSAYLATITVLGREKISVNAGTFNAIKLDLQLNKIGKTGGLEPHRKFRRATIWISDDADRLLLRIEAQIFVGTVFAELESARFESSKK